VPIAVVFICVCWIVFVMFRFLIMEQRLARSRCFYAFLFLSTFFVQVLSLSYKLPKTLSIPIMLNLKIKLCINSGRCHYLDNPVSIIVLTIQSLCDSMCISKYKNKNLQFKKISLFATEQVAGAVSQANRQQALI
jgi:hypothetical protein